MKIRKTSTHIFATCQLRTWHASMSFQPHNNDLWVSKQTSCHFTSGETEAQRREAAPAILAWVRSNYGSQTWTWLQPHTHTHTHTHTHPPVPAGDWFTRETCQEQPGAWVNLWPQNQVFLPPADSTWITYGRKGNRPPAFDTKSRHQPTVAPRGLLLSDFRGPQWPCSQRVVGSQQPHSS